jgi:hypothetical protein
MKTYDRASLKQVAYKEEVRQSATHFWENDELWDFFNGDYYDHVTMDDVRIGWLLSLLIKLNLKTPKERIKHLRW